MSLAGARDKFWRLVAHPLKPRTTHQWLTRADRGAHNLSALMGLCVGGLVAVIDGPGRMDDDGELERR
jgi:hypothetical protein